MIIHKYVLRDINECMVKRNGEGMGTGGKRKNYELKLNRYLYDFSKQDQYPPNF